MMTPACSWPVRNSVASRLAWLFGTLYFVQGIAEPTEGLIAQPVRALLKSEGRSPAEIGTFCALLALPWAFKPLYGLITDFVPFCGTRRRAYLLLSTGATILGLCLAIFVPKHATFWLLAWLLIPTWGVAFSDVVVDALMVERGQPWGITGWLQAVQWGSMYTAILLTGWLGGWLSHFQRTDVAFLICAGLTGVTWLLAWFAIEETPIRGRRPDWRGAGAALWGVLQSPGIWATSCFVLLWNFNPFSSSVLYLYCTTQLHFTETFYGSTQSLFAAGAVLASLGYGRYGSEMSFYRLVHLSILTNVVSTLAYIGMHDATSAVLISLFVGFTYMTGNLVLLELAARSCPLAAAGTTFAVLMGLSNFSVSLSAYVGGHVYEWGARGWGTMISFRILVLAGTLTTCSCWAILPWLRELGSQGTNLETRRVD